MALKIRLARGGAKKRPYYRIVVADIRSPRDGRFVERIGRHDPMLPKDHDDRVVIDEERVKYWLGVGAKPTSRVARFLAAKGLMDKPAVPDNQTKKNQPRAKAQERLREAEEKATEAAEAAAAAAAEAAAPAEEAPAEEAPAE